STCKISGCLSYRILDSGPDGTQTTLTSKQSVTQAINVLSRSLEKGYTPEEIINQSIASGWQGIFEPKTPKGKSQPRPQHRAMQENFTTKDYGQTEMPSWAQE
ncbi:UNVERIFIED_CONTAM: hypothetical protein NQD88_08165, partial [Escherichia coli]|nr:hypothetical protein [Escherichia coli]MDR6040751.1 hypothetical protein [Escherichia coli]MDR6049080.1 hypothetical protein [Escherichia coli]